MEPEPGASTPSLPVGGGVDGIVPDGGSPGFIGLEVAPAAGAPATGLV